MNRQNLIKKFSEMGSRLTIRKGTNLVSSRVIAINVVADKLGEHFTMTIHPSVDETKIDIQVLDMDKKLRQMLLLIVHYYHPTNRLELEEIRNPTRKVTERLLLGHDEMHWFVSGVTMSKTIKEAFENLRPRAVTLSMHKSGVRDKDWRRRKTKGFIRQGEWFFVPVNYQEDKNTIILKNEPIQRPGSTAHIVEEAIRIGGRGTVYVIGSEVITEHQFKSLSLAERSMYHGRVIGARLFARGKVTHRDHHTIFLKGWHEVYLSRESTSSSNAFID